MPVDGDPALDPDRIRATGFSTSFRGYDQHEVRRFLDRVAEALRADRDRSERTRARVRTDETTSLQAEVAQRDATIEGLRAELAAHEAELAEASVFDEHRAAELLGRETTRVLEAARRAAAELTRKATEDAGQVRAELEQLRTSTQTELGELRAGAGSEVDALRRKADEDAAGVRAEAEAEAERLRADAVAEAERRRAEADEVRAAAATDAEQIRAEAAADAEAAIEAAREQGRQMIAEARSVRERVLSDLVRRRRASRQQVDQLKAGRDRLARALSEVRRQLDDAMGELTVAVPEARQAAEVVARREDVDVAGEVADLERDLDSARTLDSRDWERASRRAPSAGRADAVGSPTGGGVVAVDEREATEGADAVSGGPVALPLDPRPGTAPSAEAKPPAPGDGVGAGERRRAAGMAPVAAGGGREGSDLDSLFARIRATRSQAVSEARQVLASAPPSEAAPAGGEPLTVGEPVGSDDAPAGTSADREPTAGAESGHREGERPADVGDLDPAADDAQVDTPAVEPFAARDDALAPLERDLLRKLKRTMADAQSELLDLVGRGRGALSADALPKVSEHRERYTRAAGRSLTAALRAGAAAGGGRVDEAHAAELVERLAHQVANPIQARVEESIRSAGDERDVILERIRAHYREFRTGELAGLVSDTLAEAYAVGLYRSFGPGTPLVWVADPRVAVGPDCFDNSLAGAVVVPDAYPTGHLHPPGAPGCRCLTLPVPD